MTVNVTLRSTKGSPLTTAEVDANFSALAAAVGSSSGGSAGVSSFNSRSGAVSLTSADVVTALGFTPGTGSGGSAGVSSFNSRTGAVSLTSADVVAALGFTPSSGSGTTSGGSSGVSSVNGKTGEVILVPNDISSALGFMPASVTAVVTSMNGRQGAVTLTSSDITTALGFTPSSGSGGGTAGVTTFNSRSGAVTLSSSDVTAALGFTPSSGGVSTFNSRSGAVSLTSADVVAALGFTPSSGGGSAGVTSVNGRTGAVTIASGDVTSALGFTPASTSGVVTSLRDNLSNSASGTITVSSTSLSINILNNILSIQINGSSCLHQTCVLNTTTGPKFAMDIRPGDVLVQHDGTQNKVLGLWSTVLGDRRWVQVNNCTITEDHLVKLQNGGWAVYNQQMYMSIYDQKTFTLKTLTGIATVKYNFDTTNMKMLEVGDVLSTGETVTSITAFHSNAFNTLVHLYTEQPYFTADGIEVSGFGSETM